MPIIYESNLGIIGDMQALISDVETMPVGGIHQPPRRKEDLYRRKVDAY